VVRNAVQTKEKVAVSLQKEPRPMQKADVRRRVAEYISGCASSQDIGPLQAIPSCLKPTGTVGEH
jgi:hypothetical protein